MLLAMAGIFLILGLLGVAAFFVGKEQLDAMLSDGQAIGRAPARSAQSH